MRVAAIIYDVDTKYILTGKESFYCFEKSDHPREQARLDELEQCTEYEAMYHAFELSEMYQLEIRYTEFEHGKTHFVCQTTNSHWGIVKGHGEKGESAIEAITRETYEEVGIIIPKNRWKRVILPHLHRPTHTFLVGVSAEERVEIEAHIEERRLRHCGELFDLSFRDINHVPQPMNHITRHIKEWLYRHELPSYVLPYPISYSKLLDYTPVSITYKYDHIYEPEFVWGKRRLSLLPIH